MTKKEIIELVKKSLDDDYVISGQNLAENSDVDLDRFQETLQSNIGNISPIRVYIDHNEAN